MGGKGNWNYDSRSSKEWKRDWLDSRAAELVKRGHTKQRARTLAKEAYRNLSR